MVWRVRASCTYSSSTSKNSALSAVNTLLAGYTNIPVAGRYAAGVASPTTTTLTVSVDVPNQADGLALANSIMTALNGTTKYSSGMASVHQVI